MKTFPDSANGWVRYAVLTLFTISLGLFFYGEEVSGMRGAGWYHFYSRMALRWAVVALIVVSLLGIQRNRAAGIFGVVSAPVFWFLYLLTDGVRES